MVVKSEVVGNLIKYVNEFLIFFTKKVEVINNLRIIFVFLALGKKLLFHEPAPKFY